LEARGRQLPRTPLLCGARLGAIGFAIADGYSFHAVSVGAKTWSCPDDGPTSSLGIRASAQACRQDHRDRGVPLSELNGRAHDSGWLDLLRPGGPLAATVGTA